MVDWSGGCFCNGTTVYLQVSDRKHKDFCDVLIKKRICENLIYTRK